MKSTKQGNIYKIKKGKNGRKLWENDFFLNLMRFLFSLKNSEKLLTLTIEVCLISIITFKFSIFQVKSPLMQGNSVEKENVVLDFVGNKEEPEIPETDELEEISSKAIVIWIFSEVSLLLLVEFELLTYPVAGGTISAEKILRSFEFNDK